MSSGADGGVAWDGGLGDAGPIDARLGDAGLGDAGVPSNPQKLALKALCSAKTSGNRAVSIVFSAETADGKPVTDLDTWGVSWVVEDGGATSGSESQQWSLKKAQDVEGRALLVLDGSESLVPFEDSLRAAAREFVRTFFCTCARLSRCELGIYKFYGAADLVRVIDFTSDPEAVLTALEVPVTKVGASTALHSAIQGAIALLQTRESTSAATGFSTSTLVLFTDGRDEVTSGTNYGATKDAAIAKAKAFYAQQGHSVISIGLGTTVDTQLLSSIATPAYGFRSIGSGDLAAAFRRAADDSLSQASKFYKFNLCSNRRQGTVAASLSLKAPWLSANAISFSYNAAQLQDGDCNPEDGSIATCSWSASTAASLPAATACGPTETMCARSCVSLQTDVRNCGSCAHQCPSNASCNGGRCACPAANPWLCEGAWGADCFGGASAPACNTVKICSDGKRHACFGATQQYDCATGQCW